MLRAETDQRLIVPPRDEIQPIIMTMCTLTVCQDGNHPSELLCLCCVSQCPSVFHHVRVDVVVMIRRLCKLSAIQPATKMPTC